MADLAADAEAWGFSAEPDPHKVYAWCLAVRAGRNAILDEWNEWPADAERKALAVVRGLIREGLI